MSLFDHSSSVFLSSDFMIVSFIESRISSVKFLGLAFSTDDLISSTPASEAGVDDIKSSVENASPKNFTDEMRDSINETIMKSEDKKTEDE